METSRNFSGMRDKLIISRYSTFLEFFLTPRRPALHKELNVIEVKLTRKSFIISLLKSPFYIIHLKKECQKNLKENSGNFLTFAECWKPQVLKGWRCGGKLAGIRQKKKLLYWRNPTDPKISPTLHFFKKNQKKKTKKNDRPILKKAKPVIFLFKHLILALKMLIWGFETWLVA